MMTMMIDNSNEKEEEEEEVQVNDDKVFDIIVHCLWLGGQELQPSYVRCQVCIAQMFDKRPPQEAGNSRYFALMVDYKLILRNCQTDMVNVTRLLNCTNIPGWSKKDIARLLRSLEQEDNLLDFGRSEKENQRMLISYSHVYLRGLWISLERCRSIVAQLNLKHLFWPLLHDKPEHFQGFAYMADKSRYGSLETNQTLQQPSLTYYNSSTFDKSI